MIKADSHSTVEAGITECLRYFAIFDYPLTAAEIFRFCTVKSTREEVDRALAALLEKDEIKKIDDFYMPDDKPEWVSERLDGNKRAEKLLGRSGRFVRIIASFPFVRGIAISGSLSKNYANLQADIDYFIITESDRLWISRSLLHFFKKLTFITGHQHFFCMNYFVDENELRISHPSIYSAIETVTVLPVYNLKVLQDFIEANLWTKDYQPNASESLNNQYVIKKGKQYAKRFSESLLNLIAPKKLNKFLMRITDRKWRRKWEKAGYDLNEYDKAFLTRISVSKNHPVDYEKKVLNELAPDGKTVLQSS